MSMAAEPPRRLRRGDERILVVDDECKILLLIKSLLGELGYTITAATSSTEALELYFAEPDSFALVICDLVMPTMHGITLATRLRSHNPALPIILMTGGNNVISPQELAALGYPLLVSKPFNLSTLTSAIACLLDQETPAACDAREQRGD